MDSPIAFVKYELKGSALHIHSGLKSDINEQANEITRKIIDLEDKVVKSSLIKLGWTPPKLPTNSITSKGSK